MFKQYFWKGIPTNYEVNEEGVVRRIDSKLIISGIDVRGYRYAALYIVDPNNPNEKKKDRQRRIGIHRMVAETFIPNPENKPEVNHKDGNRANNHVDNLEWVTHSENINHAVNTLGKMKGRIQHGENNYAAKYTEIDIRKVCELLEMDKYTVKQISQITGVPEGTIIAIRVGKEWTEVSKDYRLPEVQKKPRPSDDDIREICEFLVHDNTTSFAEIGAMFGVARKTVERIYKRQTRTNITKDYEFALRGGTEAVEAVCRALATDGEIPFRQLGLKYGLDSQTVANIYYRRYYRDISDKYEFIPRDNSKYMNKDKIKDAAIACSILGIPKKKSAFRKNLYFPRERHFFDLVYKISRRVTK